jgi:hypothetical protein
MKETRNLATAFSKASRPATATEHATQKREPTVSFVRAPVREGKRQIAGWFSPDAWRQLRGIALDEDSSTQELLREALNDLFVKRQKAPLA